MGLVLVDQLNGIGTTSEQSNPSTVTSGIFLTLPDYQFDTKTSFATEADWKTAIAAGEIYPIQGILEEENMNVEDKIYESPTGKKAFQYEGQRGKKFKVLLPLELHKILRTYSFKNWRYFRLDENNNIEGTTDGTVVKGRRLSFCYVGKQEDGNADGPAFSTITIQERNVDEKDEKGISVNPTWFGADLEGVLSVVLTPSAVAANSCTATVAYVDNSRLTSAGAATSVPVSGLVAANFEILNGSTEVTAGKTVTESSAVPGTYTIAATTLVAGYTVQVIATSSNLFKSDAKTLAS